MGKYTFSKSSLSLDGMSENFLQNKMLPFIHALPFDTVITSAHRSMDDQAAKRKVYDQKVEDLEKRYRAGSITKDQYEKEKAALRGQIANRPGYSAHNWGLALDIHPVSGKDKDYQTMLEYSGKFGLKRDAVERWHFQDTAFDFKKAELWLKELAANGKITVPLLILFFLIIALILYFKYKK